MSAQGGNPPSENAAPTGGSVIRGMLRSRWRSMVAGCAFMMGHQIGESLVPVAIGFFIDRAVRSGDYSDLLPGVIVLILVFAGLSNSWRFGAKFLQRAAKGAEHDLRVAVVRRVLDPAGPAEGNRLPGELLNIAAVDAERVGRIANVTATAAGAFAALVVTTFVLLRISIPLGLLVIVGTIPLIALIQLLGRTLEKHSGTEQAEAARAAGIANDLVYGLRVLKGIGAEDAAVERYRGASRSSLTATVRAAKTQATYQGLNMALTGAFLALVALVGGRLAANGEISIGDLIAALGLTQFLIGPMQRLTNVGALFARGRASAARIAGVLAPPPEAGFETSPLPAGFKSSLQVQGLSHASLENLTFDIDQGETVGIVAADPNDALSLLDCLSGSEQPESGRVLLGGIPIDDFSPADLHATLVVTPHESYLFAETVLDNILEPAPESEVDWAITASAADEVVENLPDGVSTMVSEGGRSLSGGQRQRVALARALAALAPVLVLHDPTTAVDSVTEARIADGISRGRAGRTTILVTTSPALLAVTSRVIFIESGRVASQASHADLLDTSADYQELVVS